MRVLVLAAALLSLAACQNVAHNLAEGERLNWRCDGGKHFSLRYAAGAAEVYASGQTHHLPPVESAEGERRYSNGELTYIERGGRAWLTGVYGGPFENCRRRANPWRFL